MSAFINLAWPLAVAASVVLAACQTERESSSATRPYASATDATARDLAQAQARPAAARRDAGPTATLAFPTGQPSTSSILIERFMPTEVVAGMPAEYETLVTNLTSIALDQVVVSETIDDNFVISSTEPDLASTSGGTNAWNLGTLAPHETVSILVRGTAKNVPAIQNCTSVSYATSVCAAFPVTLPALSLTAAGTQEAIVCDNLRYEYTVTNTGTGTARDVVVAVKLPDGVTDEHGMTTVTKTFDSIATGQSLGFSVSAKGSKRGTFAHTATATAMGDLKATANEIRTTLRQPMLELEGESTPRTFGGRTVTAVLTVTNKGDVVAREVAVEMTVPATTKLKAATDRGAESDGLVRWTLANLKPNESRNVTADFTSSILGHLTMTAAARTYCAAPVEVRLESDIEGIPAILLEVVDVEDPVRVGDEVSYEITITNQGTAPATNVMVGVDLPEQATFLNSTGQTATAAQPGATRVAFLPVASIAPGAKVSWHFHVRGTKAGDGRLRVRMTSNELSSPVEETEATFFYVDPGK